MKKIVRLKKLPFNGTYSPKWTLAPVIGEGVFVIWAMTKQEAKEAASTRGWIIAK
jgi:hypothetical protein